METKTEFVFHHGAMPKKASTPRDTARPKASVSADTAEAIGENAFSTFKVTMAYDAIKSIATTAGNAVLNSISSDNATLQRQISVARSVTSKVTSTALSFAVNPILGAVQVAGEAINYSVGEANFRMNVAWNDYDREQMQINRGYFSNNLSRR